MEDSSNTIKDNNILNNTYGIWFTNSSSVITNNLIKASSQGAIESRSGSFSIISANRIIDNGWGIYLQPTTGAKISENEITGNGSVGISISGSNTVVFNNKIYDNPAGHGDIEINTVTASVSFNVADEINTVAGGSYTGCYNVTSSGVTLPCYP